MEIEVKLTLDPTAAPALRRHPLLAHYRQRRSGTRRIENRYFDTPGLDLHRQGLELRLRRDGRRNLQTLKAALNTDAGLHRREEWEGALDGPALDIPALAALLPPDAAATARLLHAFAARGDLGVRVTTRYRRTAWLLQSVNGDKVELALDIGEIVAAERALPLCEVEIELVAGEARALFALAGALQADLPLRPESRGKAARGFALLASPQESAQEPPRLARPVPIERDMTPAAALRAITLECLAQVQANEAGVMACADAEYVHQMRVGLRRLRSALALFKPIASPPAALVDELRWSAEELGHARDAEVLAHETLARIPVPAAADIDWLALRKAADANAEQARRKAAAAVRTPRHVAWQLALMAWACGIEQAHIGIAGESLSDFAAGQLRRLRKRLLARGAHLPGTEATDRHAARIAAKKLRYACEMLGALHPAFRGRGRLQALASLQQQLGPLNDAEVAATRLSSLAADAPALPRAVAFAQGWLAADAERRVRRLRKLWKRVRPAVQG